MTTSTIVGIIDSLISPYINSLRGHLASIGTISGTIEASDFHSLLSWPEDDGQYHLVYNKASAVLFLNNELVGVAPFERALLAQEHPETKFDKPDHHPGLAEGAL